MAPEKQSYLQSLIRRGIAYVKHKRAEAERRKEEEARRIAEAARQVALEKEEARLAAIRALNLAPPTDGMMSVGIQQVEEAVCVWIFLTEATKHSLESVLDQPVDEFPRDPEQEAAEIRRYMHGMESDAKVARREYDKWERAEDLATAQKIFSRPYYISLRDMLSCPFKYHFLPNKQTAAEYIERLKTKVLPKIKIIIEGQAAPKTESFQL